MQTIISRIQRFMYQESLIPDNAPTIIGLSGGPDSIFLLHVLANVRLEKNITIIAAHLNHEWRPEAHVDAQLCQSVCDALNIPLVTKKISELGVQITFNGSKEEIGRKARRFFFESLAKEYAAQAIALAHHADDQMETFFIRLIRGASLAGLVGIKAKDGLYIRPLLETRKQDILEYLHANEISYTHDASNESTDFLRNRIRKSVIPALQHCDARFDANFFGTHNQLAHTEDFLQHEAQRIFKEICTENIMNIKRLVALHPVVRTRVIILWLCSAKVPFIPSQGFFDEIARFLESRGIANHTFYGKWQICKNHDNAHIKII